MPITILIRIPAAFRTLLLALLVVPTLHAASQSISEDRSGVVRGVVVDARTGQPLAQVIVTADSIEPAANTPRAGHSPPRSVTTDRNGRFELVGLPRAPVRLFVSVVGYILVQRTVDLRPGSVDLRIPLTEGTGTHTETVTVTADRFRTAEPGVAAQHTLGSADLQNLRGVLADDPLRAVQTLPGVATGDDLRSEFSVRGSDFGHINFTVEGVPAPFLLHTVRAVEDRASSGSVAMINSDILEDVTLLNGGYAQRYGNRTGAEIAFRLREGSRGAHHLRVAVSGTSAAVVGEGPLGGSRRGSWIVSARKSYLDLLIDRLTDDGIAFGFADAQGKIVYDVTPRQRVELAIVAGRSRLEEAEEEVDANDLFAGRNAAAVGIATWRMTGRRGFVITRALAGGNAFRNDTIGGVDLDTGDDRQRGVRADAAVAIRSGLHIQGGAQIERNEQGRRRQRPTGLTTFREINDFRAHAARTGGYAQIRWDATRALTVIPGARVDFWSLTDQRTASPWLQAEWRPAPRTTIRGGLGVYRQFADFEQVIGALGTAGMPPERATHLDLGIEHRFNSSLRGVVALYNRADESLIRRPGSETRLVDGEIVRGSITSPFASRLDGTARGIEVLLQRRDPNGLSGWLAYSFGRNRYEDVVTGESFWGDLDQRHALNAYVTFRLSARANVGAKLRMGTNFPAPGFYRRVAGEYFIGEERNEVRLPVYARLDLRATRTFTWSGQRLTLFAEVMNVLNRDNVRYNPPSIDSRTGRAARLFESLIPIVPSAGILVEF